MKHFLSATSAVAISLGLLIAMPATTRADVVHVDDTIVQGSLCVGFDCVNGENFGFDTMRLKENNLRIHFDDTSSSGSFPSNDWRIVVNDSSNGGASYFSVEDSTAGRTPFRIDAGAPANSLRIDSGGDVGIGVDNPVVPLHVRDGNTPTLRLEQDGSSGFTPQIFDVAANEANFFIRDVTNGSALPFRIQPGADENSLYIAAGGNVGIGTASPAAALQVVSADLLAAEFAGTGNKQVRISSTSGGAVQVRLQSDSTNRRIISQDASGVQQSQIILGDQSIVLAGPTTGAGDIWAEFSAAGLITLGPSCNPGPCDGTFDPSVFEVPSIREHAEYMWENRHLWGVGPTSPDEPFNVTEKTAGILHELEVAHIYIAELDARLRQLESEYTPVLE